MICYSIMLLNTDLHLADIEQKMTRSQFIKNTMTTITQAVHESAPDAFMRPSILPEKNGLLSEHGRDSPDPDYSSRRRSLRPTPRSESRNGDDPGPLVRAPFHGHRRAWEEQVEFVLKAIYASIRDEKLPLFGAEPDKSLGVAPSQSGLSVMGMLKRSPSVLSKAPSETQLSSRGRVADGGGGGSGFGSVAGSPETIRNYMDEYVSTGANYFVAAFQWGDLTHEQAMRSIELFTNEVMPHYTG